jgi:hypothetical protein
VLLAPTLLTILLVAGDGYRLALYNPDRKETARTEYFPNASCVTINDLPKDWSSGTHYWWVTVGHG